MVSHYDGLILSAHCIFFATVFWLVCIWAGHEAATSLRKKKDMHNYIERFYFLIGDRDPVVFFRYYRMGKDFSQYLLFISQWSAGKVSVRCLYDERRWCRWWCWSLNWVYGAGDLAGAFTFDQIGLIHVISRMC